MQGQTLRRSESFDIYGNKETKTQQTNKLSDKETEGRKKYKGNLQCEYFKDIYNSEVRLDDIIKKM